jgi:hypothetical protein
MLIKIAGGDPRPQDFRPMNEGAPTQKSNL